MTDRTVSVLLGSGIAVLVAVQVAAAAGYLARRDHASWPQAITRAATAFAAVLTLSAVVTEAMYRLIQ